jgi:large exoprotein involved in heme utilization and adhesion
LGGSFVTGGIGAGLGSPATVAGDIKVNATGDVKLADISVVGNIVNVGAVGKGGAVELNAGNLSVTNGAQLQAITKGQGDAGSVKIIATGDVAFDGTKDGATSAALSTVEQGSVGKGGGVEINARNLSVTNGAQLQAITRGQGDAGNIKIIAKGDVAFDGIKDGFSSAAFSTVEQSAVGKGGGIEINARNLSVTNGAALAAGTRGQGDAGSIKIIATGNVAFDNNGAVFSTVEQGAVGKGGGIELQARNLSVTNGAALQASTRGQGDAGSVKIIATGDVAFDNNGAVFSTVEQGAVGKGGGIELQARNLSVTNGAALQASTRGQGDAGSVKIIATGDVAFDGIKDGFSSGAFSTVQPGAEGKGGGIEITTGNLSATNGAVLNAATFGKGDAGSIKVTATGNISFDSLVNGFPSGAFSTVEQGGQGKGGSVEISAQNLLVTNGAEVGAFTRGQGSAGSVKITAKGHVSLDGKKDGVNSGVFSTVEKGGIGKGGGIEITADNLSVTNFATVTTSSKGQGDAGGIFLNANKIVLNNPNDAVVDINNGGIISIALGSTGGDIKVVAKDYLLLRTNSLIATNSFSTGKDGNGGNITISSPLLIATPGNNDITANAVRGNGGNLKIASQGLFGIQFRPKGQESNLTSDITANSISGRDGNVNIDTPGTDPGRDSTELPNTTTDASNQISQVCSADNRQNKLTVAGRGGLPPNANDPLTSDVVWQDARATSSQSTVSSAPTPAKLAPPAVGWVFDGKGKVTLIAAGTQGQTGTRVACPQGMSK